LALAVSSTHALVPAGSSTHALALAGSAGTLTFPGFRAHSLRARLISSWHNDTSLYHLNAILVCILTDQW
jgi:hypothetical protein